ncbi:MAG: glucosamine 6-phosphate synthetase [Bacteroidetes bacterium]|nr:glucosamine 6-phosphate synthetase [Bacteroidota bacterium]
MGNIALLFNYMQNLLLASNNGSLYFINTDNTFIFASESLILKTLIKKEKLKINSHLIKQLNPNNALLLDISTLSISVIDFKNSESNFNNEIALKTLLQINELTTELNNKGNYINTSLNHYNISVPQVFIEHYNFCKEKNATLKRCNKCLLPETFPFIEFDEKGVCNKCNSYIKQQPLGIEALKEKIAPFKKNNGKPDCIVAFSGGRDSSYSLHVIKNILGLTPLAYSYDWGMLTDLARRNQARMCGKMGIEHILISADIRKKRINIRKNVLAWLNKPSLGTIPLFMAGDKQYFYFASKLQKQYNLPLLIMGENHFEKTGFKVEFTGARQQLNGSMAYNMTIQNKIRILYFYVGQFLKNPAFINKSLFDTFAAFFIFYGHKHNHLNIYDYISWNEKEIENLLLNEYHWETEPEYDSTWRIGDGTAAFYNYIYYIVTGFTENDTLRSNLIREGAISREEALKKCEKENLPRWNAINWYCNTIGIDFENTIRRINKIPKIF